MRTITLTSRKVVAVGFAVTVLTAGAAYAYWTSEGSGTGVAPTAAGTTALTLNQANDVDPMFPGDSTQALSGTFGNTNDGPIYVNTVTVSIDSVVDGNGVAMVGCSADDYTLAGEVMTVGAAVPVGTSVGTWGGATIQFNNTGSNQNACKSANVNLAYAVG
jgi:hypothetical protein